MTVSSRLVLVPFALQLFAVGCTTPGEIGQAKQYGIYGTDDRKDYFESTDDTMKRRLAKSTVAIMPDTFLDTSNPNDIRLTSMTMQQAYNTCSSERFNSQPASAECSATLIDDDLILTAGHCAQTTPDCQTFKFVFKYYYESSGTLATITSEDVFDCRRVVVQRLQDIGNDTSFDYAIIQLDRSATPRFEAAPVRRGADPLPNNEPVTLVSFPLGLPGKIAPGRVLDPLEVALGYYLVSIDAYEGGSGGAMYNGAGEVVGMEARGPDDFVDTGTCLRSAVFADDGSDGTEEGSYVSTAIDALCATATGQASARLCGDGGVTPVDGGQTVADAGTADADAGTTGPDGGANADGGTAARDGGADGGTNRPPSSGGCSATGGAPLNWAFVAMLALVAMGLQGRRRTRARHAARVR